MRLPRRFLSDLIFWLATLAWLANCAAGCHAPANRPAGVTANYLSWSESLAHGKGAWPKEAKKRFDNPFVFVCHGDTSDGKSWWVAPDDRRAKANIEAVGKLLHDLMPDRDVVLVSCDHAGLTPHLPRRVWFAGASVWSLPQSAYPWFAPKDVAKDINAFIEGDGK